MNKIIFQIINVPLEWNILSGRILCGAVWLGLERVSVILVHLAFSFSNLCEKKKSLIDR